MMFTSFQSWAFVASFLILIWLLATTMKQRAEAADAQSAMTIEDEAANAQRIASTAMMIAEIDAIGEDTITKLAVEQRRSRQQTGNQHVPYNHEVDGL